MAKTTDSQAGGSMVAGSPHWAGFDRAPVVMGVLNVTPDSFSDGGESIATADAIAAGRQMIADGAGILDIGGESTRPGAQPVSLEDEQRRILPVIAGLVGLGIPLSVDTRNAGTMAAALDAGVTIVNDVSALSHDPAAARLIADRGCPILLMHMRGTPVTMQAHATYDDVAMDVLSELAMRISAAQTAGIDRSQIAVDPGIGFAKTAEQNIILLQRLPILLGLGCRIAVGVSRKSFIGRLGGAAIPRDRMPGSIAAGVFALSRGASILRVHDVSATVQAVRVWQALAG